MTYTFCGKECDVTRINNDVNGNPRYVIHFLIVFHHKGASETREAIKRPFDTCYDYAVSLAKKTGFKRYHNKSYGGGLVFQSYNIQEDLNFLERTLDKYFNMGSGE